ncbi:MAG TPA: DUF4203 domain-containing protein [Candidatus Pullilachnospira intestinigallinarum]|nr:DUF4203 domain-containing protein [Candidatus Pullilachnospira intestinigallinarum]
MQEFLSQYPGITEQLGLLKQVGLMFGLLFGALNCFMGFRLLRVWTALGGFVLGAGIGLFLGGRFLDAQWAVWLVTLAVGVVAATLAYQIYLVGAFLLGWLLTVSVTISLVRPMDIGDKEKLALMAAGALLGLVVGVLIVAFSRPIIIVSTGISGAASMASGLGGILGWSAVVIGGLTVLLAAAGIAVQFFSAPEKKRRRRDE